MSLPTWNAGEAREEILAYLARITSPHSPELVPVEDRLAVFDNDGTLWCEKPAYPQALFILEGLRARVEAEPALAERPVVKALLAGDLNSAVSHGMAAVAEVLLDIHAGLTTEEFDRAAAQWATEFRHPRFGTDLEGLTYAPMIELVELLREHEFRVFIVTGGGVDFVRAVSSTLYEIDAEDVVGSAVEVEFGCRDGQVVLERTANLAGSPNEGPPKVRNIHAKIGRRPILAAGNSAGDREMLEFAHTSAYPSLCLVVNHDDEEREYAYGGEALTDPTAEPILETAARFGWRTVSMRDDWNRVFR